MQSFWDILSQLQIFFQLNFLLTGLELSSTSVFIIRSLVFLSCLIGFIWGFFRIALKILDVAQTLAAALGPLPRSFFLLLFLIIPLSDNSIGGKWIGYLLLTFSAAVLTISIALTAVMWKYGVDQTLRVINFFRSRSKVREESSLTDQCFTENAKSTL